METRKSKPIRRPLPKETRMLKQQAKKRAGLLVLSGLFFILIGYSLVGNGYGLPIDLPFGWGAASTKELILPQSFSIQANQKLATDQKNATLPLYLQTDERWGELAYGSTERNNDLAHNGCALASIAMVASYWQRTSITPAMILKWAKNDYYVNGQGTAWQIFEDYAVKNGYHYENIGNYFNRAKEFMNDGVPVIVSVNAGTFTTTGHIMVLTTDETGALKAYDPNDSPTKKHYLQAYANEVFIDEGVNYWALWKE